MPRFPLTPVVALLFLCLLPTLSFNLGVVSNSRGSGFRRCDKIGRSVCDTFTTQLFAIGALARKAKEAEVKQWLEAGGAEEVKNVMLEMSGDAHIEVQPLLKDAITKRRRTLSVVAEYKRNFKGDGYVNEIFEPDLMSPIFREFGASACAVMTDKRVGGCDYDDLKTVTDEQENSRGDIPGPLPVVCSDMIVADEQIARAKLNGAQAVLLQLGLLNEEVLKGMMEKAAKIGLETVVQASTEEEVKTAVALGAKIIKVNSIEEIEVKEEWREMMGEDVTAVADISANDNKQLEEVEEAWKLRDAGYQAVWVSDCLYKSGNDPTEHAGAIIQAMKAKSSVKYASPRSKSGKGEGSREYLGDIMM